MAARVLAAFGNRSARRQAPSPLFLAPPRLTDNASRPHPSHSPMSRSDLQTLRSTRACRKCLEQAPVVEPTRAETARTDATCLHAETTVAEPRGYDHADLLADEPQSEHSPDVPYSHPAPFTLPSILSTSDTLLHTLRTFTYSTRPPDSPGIRYLL